jgi:hypothetical protein
VHPPRFLTRETRIALPDGSALLVHSARWRPGTITAMGFQAAGWPTPVTVPPEAWNDVQALIARDEAPTSQQILSAIATPPH